jgi:hypothetical protein
MTLTNLTPQTARIVAAVVSLLLPAVAVLVSYFVWRDDLPPELASHWSGTGPADGVMSVAQFLTVSLVMTAGAAVIGGALALWPGVTAAGRRGGLLVAGIIAGAGAQTWLVSAVLTMRVGDPYDVVLGVWGFVGFAAVAYGLVPFLLAPKPQLESRDVQERISFAPGEEGAWSRTVTANLFLWGTVVLIVVAVALYGTSVVTGQTSDALFGLSVIAVIALVVASLSRFRVTADWRGLRVVSSIFRFPLKHIPLENIEMVEANELRPSEWGGWGYRVMPGRSALILRRGPGLIVTTTNQKQFALTLDNPAVPAALLATLRDKRRASAL